MAKMMELLMRGVPLGFPLGWIAARLSDGKYEIALFDFVACLALIGALSIIGHLEDTRS